MEVGGAYAQKFFPLLEYLELKTLVITDIDAVRPIDGRRKKCICADGQFTSNSALKSWFNDNDIGVTALITKTAEEKTRRFYRIAYQMPEDGSAHCARTYEDALILANLVHFGIADNEKAAVNAWEAAQDFKKSEEAIRFAIMEDEWTVPKYVREGLVWLSEPPPPPAAPPLPIPNEPVEDVT